MTTLPRITEMRYLRRDDSAVRKEWARKCEKNVKEALNVVRFNHEKGRS